jgi:hypothetical protein
VLNVITCPQSCNFTFQVLHNIYTPWSFLYVAYGKAYIRSILCKLWFMMAHIMQGVPVPVCHTTQSCIPSDRNISLPLFQYLIFACNLFLPSSGTCAPYKVLKMGAVNCYWQFIILILTSYVHRLGRTQEQLMTFSAAEDMCRVSRKVACCYIVQNEILKFHSNTECKLLHVQLMSWLADDWLCRIPTVPVSGNLGVFLFLSLSFCLSHCVLWCQ